MSGGHFNYQDSSLKSEMFGWGDKRYSDPMEDVELSQMVYELLDLLHDLDWYKSGDTGDENYLEAKAKFKNKWLRNKNYNDVIKDLIEEEFENKKQELLKMIV